MGEWRGEGAVIAHLRRDLPCDAQAGHKSHGLDTHDRSNVGALGTAPKPLQSTR
jgi:hypothetical protein